MEVKRENQGAQKGRRGKNKKNLLASHVSFCVLAALSNTSKMNYYLAGRRRQEGSGVVKRACVKWRGEVGSVYTGLGEKVFVVGLV